MSEPSSPDVTWHEGQVTRTERSAAIGARGATIWLTGLSGSGKSTVASAVEQRLVAAGRPAYRLDGDNLRTGLNGDLGFSREDREENVRRAGEVACLFADAGVVALVALISPYARSRRRAREVHVRAGVPFVEVYLSASADLCAARDPKGLYARAQTGTLPAFTGIDDPYEPPEEPELTVDARIPPDEAVDLVLVALAAAEST
ncbi:MAG: adenylyl-sulfate kinase [Acidimicrobiales bacterium]